MVFEVSINRINTKWQAGREEMWGIHRHDWAHFCIKSKSFTACYPNRKSNICQKITVGNSTNCLRMLGWTRRLSRVVLIHEHTFDLFIHILQYYNKPILFFGQIFIHIKAVAMLSILHEQKVEFSKQINTRRDDNTFWEYTDIYYSIYYGEVANKTV